MLKMRELIVSSGKTNNLITFGIADTNEELTSIYKLRYQIYSSRGYIKESNYPDHIEKDNFDVENKCTYFIATYNSSIIGVIRLIKDEVLPTEKYFKFQEPNFLSGIKRTQRAELGRFIIVPPKPNEYLPRGLVRLFLINCLSEFGLKNDILGGYAFVKTNLLNKMKSSKMPAHVILPYTQTYPADGDLFYYFSQKDNPVVPIYFSTKEFLKYTNNIILNRFLFKRLDETRFSIRRIPYLIFFKMLKVL